MIRYIFPFIILLHISLFAQSEFMKMCENPTDSQLVTLEKFLNPFPPIHTSGKLVKLTIKKCHKLEKELLTRKGMILNKGNITDLSPLKFFVNLDNIVMSHNNIKDISPLANLKKLKELDIGFNPISDISPLKDLKLTKLHVYSNVPKPNAPAGLYFTPIASDISALSNITTLEDLTVSGNGQTLPDLTKLVHLKSLALIGLDMKDFCKFKNSSEIKDLWLSSNHNLASLQCIDNFKNLETLTIERAKITDLSLLKDLPKLKKLTLKDVPVSDVTPLAKMKSLEELSFLKTNIKYLSPLNKSKSLNYILNENRYKFFTKRMLSGGLQSWAQTVGDRSLAHCSPIDITELRAGVSCFEKDGTLKPWWKRMLKL